MPKTTKRSPAQIRAWKKLHPYVKHLIKKSPQSIWARRCRKEFNKACTWCAKERNLEAHHIYQQHLYPDLKEDLDNSLLLCKKCHDKIHTLYNESIEKYFLLCKQLVLLRKPIKSIKVRNPSGHKYDYEFVSY